MTGGQDLVKGIQGVATSIGNEIRQEINHEVAGVVKFSEDQVNKVVHDITQTGQVLAQTPCVNVTEDMFGHLIGPLVAKDLNSFAFEMTKGIDSLGYFLEAIAAAMTYAINRMKGMDEEHAVKIESTTVVQGRLAGSDVPYVPGITNGGALGGAQPSPAYPTPGNTIVPGL